MREKTDSTLLNVIQLVNQERMLSLSGFITLLQVPFMNFVPLNMVRQISCPERRRRSSWALTGQ